MKNIDTIRTYDTSRARARINPNEFIDGFGSWHWYNSRVISMLHSDIGLNELNEGPNDHISAMQLFQYDELTFVAHFLKSQENKIKMRTFAILSNARMMWVTNEVGVDYAVFTFGCFEHRGHRTQFCVWALAWCQSVCSLISISFVLWVMKQ